MNIVLFGGSFNPPHLGHQIVISQAFELIPQIDQLWLLPAYQHTFSKNSSLAPAKHRLAMAQLLLEDLQSTFKKPVRLCPIEIDFKMSGETYDTLQKLKTEEKYLKQTMSLPSGYPLASSRYSFLMGSDQLKSFTHWGNWQKLLQTIPFYIYPRANIALKPLYANMHPLESNNQVITNISSTMIRQRLKKGLPVKHIVPAKVLSYLKKHKLYSS